MNKELFFRRLGYEWREKLRTIRSVVDWTIALYFIVPALILSGIYYRSLWQHIPDWPTLLFGGFLDRLTPELQEQWAFFILLYVLYFVTYFRSVRSFLEEADSLFLLQSPAILRSIMIKGMVYSIFRACVTNLLLFALLLPFFVKQFHLGAIQIILLLLYFTVIRVTNLFMNRYRALRFEKRWKEWLVGILFFFIGWYIFYYGVQAMLYSPFLLFPFIVAVISILVYLIRIKLQYRSYFLKETAKERIELLRWTSAVMVGAGHTPKERNMKKPYMFPRSKNLWKKGDNKRRVIEVFIKDYFRTGSNLQFYIMMVSYSSGSFFITPLWLACLIVCFALFALYQHAGDHWKGFADKPILRLYCNEGWLLVVGPNARAYVLIPALLLYMFINALLLSVWLGIACLVLLVFIAIWFVFLPARKLM